MDNSLGWGLLLGTVCAVAVFGAVFLIATQGEESGLDGIGTSKEGGEFFRIGG
jgi:hypothetical protein